MEAGQVSGRRRDRPVVEVFRQVPHFHLLYRLPQGGPTRNIFPAFSTPPAAPGCKQYASRGQQAKRRGFRHRVDPREQTVRFVVQSSGDVERVRAGTLAVVAERESPQTVVEERLSIRSHQCPHHDAVLIESVDGAVAEVADQEIAAERAPPGGRLRDAPRRVQIAARGEAADEIAVEGKDADEPFTFCTGAGLETMS